MRACASPPPMLLAEHCESTPPQRATQWLWQLQRDKRGAAFLQGGAAAAGQLGVQPQACHWLCHELAHAKQSVPRAQSDFGRGCAASHTPPEVTSRNEAPPTTQRPPHLHSARATQCTVLRERPPQRRRRPARQCGRALLPLLHVPHARQVGGQRSETARCLLQPSAERRVQQRCGRGGGLRCRARVRV
jgi:hypothetical protein